MNREQRRQQLLDIAGKEFAMRGLHGASIESIAREAGITQAYVFQIFGTKKALFLELVAGAFDLIIAALRTGVPAQPAAIMLQLHGLASCGDPDIRAQVRNGVARTWQVVADSTDLDPVTIKSYLAFGMLDNVVAALGVGALSEPWAEGLRTPIRPGLFAHITTDTNR